MSASFDVEWCREQFPALTRQLHGRPVVYLDGPAGSQVPQRVVDAVGSYLTGMNANHDGRFVTSRESDEMLARAHEAVATFLGSPDPDLVAFGANMTTLTLSLARALSRTWKAGDEILVTHLDHDANVTPWVQAAWDARVEVRHIAIRREDCTLDLDDLEGKLTERMRLVAVAAASNAVGTINPLRLLARRAHDVGALLFVDAVHYAPHALMDVEAWDCDFLVCSAYKFFGPHVGILYGKRPLMEELPVYKLRPASDQLPHRWETGTQNHEGIAGTLAAIDYLADVGRHHAPGAVWLRPALEAAFSAIRAYETDLSGRLLEGLSGLPEVTVWGISDPGRFGQRVPTLAITHARHTPRKAAELLADKGIFVWDGNFYALPLTEALGLEPDGVVRIGLLHYNTAAEIDRLLDALKSLD
jgi:cysteine desulfurase family protein (TIGR01976 family)